MFRKEEYSSTNPEIMLVRLHPFSHYIEIELSLVWVSVWCLIMSEKPRCVLVTTIHQCSKYALAQYVVLFFRWHKFLKFRSSDKAKKNDWISSESSTTCTRKAFIKVQIQVDWKIKSNFVGFLENVNFNLKLVKD